MMDVKGRAIRTSKFEASGSVTYAIGDSVELRTDGFDIDSTKEEIQINYYDLPPVMKEGDLVILGDNG